MSANKPRSFLLPPELAQALDEDVMASGRSLNAIVVERLRGSMLAHRQTVQAQSENQDLRAEVERLEADLATRPPPDFQDLILRQSPGIARLVRERDEARAECERLKADLWSEQQSAEEWETWGCGRDAACKELTNRVQGLSSERDGLRATIRDRERVIEAHGPEIEKIRHAHRGQMRIQALIGVSHGLVIAIPLMAARGCSGPYGLQPTGCQGQCGCSRSAT